MADATTKLPRYVLNGSDSTVLPPIIMDKDASGSFEYYVAVVDGTGHTFTDDPKIIVGGSGTDDEKAELKEDVRELIKNANELKSAAGTNAAMRQKIESVEKNMREVIDRLE